MSFALMVCRTVGIKQRKERFELWKDGVDTMIKKIAPKRILVYGGEVDYDYKGIEVVYFGNETTERMDKWAVEEQALE